MNTMLELALFLLAASAIVVVARASIVLTDAALPAHARVGRDQPRQPIEGRQR